MELVLPSIEMNDIRSMTKSVMISEEMKNTVELPLQATMEREGGERGYDVRINFIRGHMENVMHVWQEAIAFATCDH